MAGIGPDVTDAHTPVETLYLDFIVRTWRLLEQLLLSLQQKKNLSFDKFSQQASRNKVNCLLILYCLPEPHKLRQAFLIQVFLLSIPLPR